MKRGSIILIIILLISLSLMPLSLAKTTTKVTDGEFRFIDAFSHQGNTYAIRAVNGHEEDAFKTSILIKKTVKESSLTMTNAKKLQITNTAM